MMPRKSVFVAHNSCLNSSYDLNIVKEGLRSQGLIIVDDPLSADEIIYSGCAAHATWADDAIRQMNQLVCMAPQKRLVVTGCIAGIDASRIRDNVISKNLSLLSYNQVLEEFTSLRFEMVDAAYSQDSETDFEGIQRGDNRRVRLGMRKKALVNELEQIDQSHGSDLAALYRRITKGYVFYCEDESVEYVAVSRSCLYECSFCAIPQGRGPFSSVPLESIIKKVERALERGIRRVALLGDEVGNYGADLQGVDFSDLLNSILSMDRDLKVRIRYIEPRPFLENFQVIERFCSEGRIDLLYIPMQTGSTKVLRDMRRFYDLNEISDKLRQLNRTTNTILYGNWMVGFPTEIESDFRDTLDLARYIDYHVSVAIPYSERPNTQAPNLKDKVGDAEVSDRLNRLRAALAELKVERFRVHLDILEPAEGLRILREIAEIEMQGIDETPNGISDILTTDKSTSFMTRQ